MTVGALSSVLSYRRASVSVEKLAAALGCDVAELMSDEAEREDNYSLFKAWRHAGRPSVVVSP